MNKELISVVVPIYNVEKYLKKCVNSLLNQSYANLEVILVNDGSPDQCSEICDAFAARDMRVKVIHKKNGGLSDARNAGIDIATGNYITFVDSDDFLKKTAIELLYNSLIKNKCDISTCRYEIVYEDNLCSKDDVENKELVLSAQDAMEDMLYQEHTTNSAWAKLYKMELFADIRYPKGRLYEDLGTTYKLFDRASKIVFNSSREYYYLQRKESIVSSPFSKSRMDGLYFASKQLDYMSMNAPKLVVAARVRLFVEAILIQKNIPNRQYKNEKRECNKVIRQNRLAAIFNVKIGTGYRLYGLLSYIHPMLPIHFLRLKLRVKA
jgi:glycosyltransferase involved in cell wall biosynthesis